MNQRIPPFRLIQRRVNMATVGLIFVGVVVSYFYLSVIDPVPTSGDALNRLDWFGLGITILIVLSLYLAGGVWTRRLDARIRHWYERLQEGGEAAEVPERVRENVLNYSFTTAAFSFIGWSVSGVMFGLLTGSLRVFIALAAVAGPLTSVTLYFIAELIWRAAIPLFFPAGNLSATRAFRLPVLGKLLIVFLLVGILPPAILVNLSWQRAQQLPTTANPQALLDNLLFLQLFILGTGIVASVGLAVFMTRTITGPLRLLQEAMKRIEQDDFAVRVPVSSNDELGYMGERLNEMAAGLEERERLKESHQKMEQELAIAWGIQSSFLPKEQPIIPGWQLTALLEPARQTSGDFYDFVPLSGGCLGILIADVADKGTGAALYMAMSRTLLRTYAYEYGHRPAAALQAANHRILIDTQSDLFVTLFYGVLDLAKGSLTYCNAGHNPPFLFRSANGRDAQPLTKTGIPLGVLDDMSWEQREVQVEPGDLLLLYTDGVTEAQGAGGAFFGEHRLLDAVRARLGSSTAKVQGTILSEVHAFMAGVPQFDDITLMLLARDS